MTMRDRKMMIKRVFLLFTVKIITSFYQGFWDASILDYPADRGGVERESSLILELYPLLSVT